MVTKKQILNQLKVVELKELAKKKGVEVKGKKADILELLSDKLTKDEIFNLRAQYITPKPDFDIFVHHMVPEHKVLTEEEEVEVLKKYNCTKYQLPEIKFTDSAAKILKARPGNVIKIVRDSPTAGKAVYYRVVV